MGETSVDIIEENDKKKDKFVTPAGIVALGILITLVIAGFIISIIVNNKEITKHYKAGCETLEELKRETNDFDDFYSYYSVQTTIEDIRDDFHYCSERIENAEEAEDKGINYNLILNCCDILSMYNEDFNDGEFGNYEKEWWNERLNKLNGFENTGDESIDNLVYVMKKECEAGLLMYDGDFQGAYDHISEYDDYVSDRFIANIYWTSKGFKNFFKESDIFSVLNNNVSGKLTIYVNTFFGYAVDSKIYSTYLNPGYLFEHDDSGILDYYFYVDGTLLYGEDNLNLNIMYSHKIRYNSDRVYELYDLFRDGKINFLEDIPSFLNKSEYKNYYDGYDYVYPDEEQ